MQPVISKQGTSVPLKVAPKTSFLTKPSFLWIFHKSAIMKLRLCRQSHLLLLLLPALGTVLAEPTKLADDALGLPEDQRAFPKPTPIGAQLAGQKPTSLAGVGTKDAPVDGKDGKPHAGPFVDRAKPDATAAAKDPKETLNLAKLPGQPDDITYHEGQKIPEANDGVMNDLERPAPKVGTTGLEGGVSQKDQERKAHEGQFGTKLEKTPESPKEAPPLPLSEQELVDAQRAKDAKARANGEATELGGLEVRVSSPRGVAKLT